MAKKKPDPDEIERKEAAVLPAREAMTLISPTTGSGLVPDLSSLPSTEGATESAGSAASDAQASGSAEESATSEDRSEHFESDDTASSET